MVVYFYSMLPVHLHLVVIVEYEHDKLISREVKKSFIVKRQKCAWFFLLPLSAVSSTWGGPGVAGEPVSVFAMVPADTFSAFSHPERPCSFLGPAFLHKSWSLLHELYYFLLLLATFTPLVICIIFVAFLSKYWIWEYCSSVPSNMHTSCYVCSLLSSVYASLK